MRSRGSYNTHPFKAFMQQCRRHEPITCCPDTFCSIVCCGLKRHICCSTGMAGYVPALAFFSDLSSCNSTPEVKQAATAVLDGRRLALYNNRAACIARWLIIRADPTLSGVSSLGTCKL